MTVSATVTFGDLLRRLRATAGLTQEELAEQSGLSVEAISALERGTRHTPRKETVLLLVEALQLADEQRDTLLAARRREVSSSALRQVEVGEPTTPLGPAVQTFLVAGLRGFARIAQERGEASATRTATRFAGLVREVVAASGGRVAQVQGGQALAVFGLPRQALQAGVALRSRWQAQPQLAVPLSIGIDAGEATATDGGGFAGGAASLAAKLAGLAGPGEVLSSEGVVHLARRIAGLYYLQRGVAQLKGIEEPVRVVQVTSEPAQEAPSGALPAVTVQPTQSENDATVSAPPIEAPLPIGGFLGALPDGTMVAREGELRELIGALDSARDSRGRFVLLSGEPGVGKTRLAQEVSVEARSRDFLVATGRCYDLHSSVPFFPFREALASAYMLAPLSVRAQVPSAWPDLLRLLPEAPEAANDGAASDAGGDVAPASASLRSPAPAGPTGAEAAAEDEQRLFWAVTRFLHALAGVRPVALLLDDLHWADSASLALLQHLVRHTRTSRVLLLGAYREVEGKRSAPLQRLVRDLGREQLVQRVALARLRSEGTAALVQSTLGEGEVAEPLVELIHKGTDGNAFFAREVLRSLVERGDVYESEGRWEARAGVSVEAPESARAVVRQRLEHLSPMAQEVVQEASVLGQIFSFEDVQALRDRAEVEVEAALEAAQAAGLIRETGADRYTFQHGLIQQALYAELPGRRRQRYHRVAGEVLSRLPERERKRRAAELEWHFVEGGVPEEALPYALMAGDQAEAVFAHAEAEQHYRSALELARELGERGREAEALFKLGSLLMTVARYDEAIQTLERAAEVARSAGDLEGRRRAMAQVGRVYARRGAGQEGVQRLSPLLATMTGEPSRGEAALQIALADLYSTSGRYREQLAAAERAAEVAKALNDDTLLAQAEQWRSSALLALGRSQEALPVLQEVIPRAEAAGDLSSHTHALSRVALAYIQRGEFEEGRGYIERALAVAQKRGDPAQIAFMTYNRGMIAVHMGQWKAARADYEQAASLMQRVGLAWTTAYPLLGLGHLSLVEGRWEEASRHLQQAIALAERSGDQQALRDAQIPLIERDLLDGRVEVARARLERIFDPRNSGRFEGLANLLALSAWMRLELGETGQAAAMAAQATTQAETEQNQLALVEGLRISARALQKQAKLAAAVAAIERALALAEAMPCPHQTARVHFTFGLIEAEEGQHEAAVRHLQAAQSLLAQLGERLYAQHIEQALSELGA
ncbi:MAG TPA: AAA family ATPase [Ktedonobacterales bacterium]